VSDGRWLVPVKPPKVYDADRIHDGVYDRATADEIIFRMSHGEFLAWICRDPRMPSFPDAWSWVARDLDGMRDRYEVALRLGHDYIAASVLEDAEHEEIGEKRTVTYKANGQTELKIETYDRLEHRKLKIDTKLKYLTKVDNRFKAALGYLQDVDAEQGRSTESYRLTGGLPDDPSYDPTNGEDP
jgi:hypothetical protein